jgi:hypothetical protein
MLAAIPSKWVGAQTPCARGGDTAAADAKLNMHRSSFGPPSRVRIEARPRKGTRRISDSAKRTRRRLMAMSRCVLNLGE